MSRDPFEFVEDAPLFVVPPMLEQLRAWHDGAKLADLPGPSPSAERERLAAELGRLGERLLGGVEAHPTKFWVLKQFQQSLEAVHGEDLRSREFFAEELERVMDVLGIGSADGVLAYYLA